MTLILHVRETLPMRNIIQNNRPSSQFSGIELFKEVHQKFDGFWPQLHQEHGLDLRYRQHQPCPLCGGKDRFNYDDKNGRGAYFCNQCGAGDGITLLSKFLGLTPLEVCKKLLDIEVYPLHISSTYKPVNEPQVDPIELHNKCVSFFESCSRPKELHPYLFTKWIKGDYIYQSFTNLIIPMKFENYFTGYQMIKPDGAKRYMKGCKKKGAYYPLGTNTATLLLAEGFATAQTLHEATGLLTFVCFDADNMAKVASWLNDKHDHYNVVVCADNDSHLPINKGLVVAQKINEQTGFCYRIPSIQGDFNDLAVQRGYSALLECLEGVI